MISDLQADIDQENEPDFSKSFSFFSSQIDIVLFPVLEIRTCSLDHFYSESFTDTTVGLPQTRRDKRQNSRPRGRRGQNKEQRRQLSEKLPNMEEIAREILPRLTLGNLWEHLVQGRPQQQRLRGRRRPQQGMIINRTTNPEITFLYHKAESHISQL